MFSRRQFIHIGTGAAVTAALAACSSKGDSSTTAPTTGSTSPPPDTTASTSSTSSSTTEPPPSSSAPTSSLPPSSIPETTVSSVISPGVDGRTLVVVQLNGGNDALNTLVPADGRYRDARPTLAIPESDLVTLAGVSDWSLHPKLAPLVPYWDSGIASFLPGIGFNDPDRSHFVSLDRWWRADDLTAATGWLGRSVASGWEAPLYATALGSGTPLLRSDDFQAAVVLEPSTFAFPAGLGADLLRGLAAPLSADQLHALAQRTMISTIDAVAAFASLLDPADAGAGTGAGEEMSSREGGLDLVQGLDLAARLITSNVGARIVVVSVGGFDTHSNQLATHDALLDDLAKGIDIFIQKVTAAGSADKTLLVTTSEFGRRVGENASGGFDHGAGGMSMMFGNAVIGGIHSEIDLGNQLDGDVRPTLDPRTLFTACLDWLGLDPVIALGARYDDVPLLKL